MPPNAREPISDPNTVLDAPQRAEWDAAGRRVNANGQEGLDRAELKEAQLALISLGYSLHGHTGLKSQEESGADGAWGPGTAAAVLQFQEDLGLETTGHIDDETLDELMRAISQARDTSAGDDDDDGDRIDGMEVESLEAAAQGPYAGDLDTALDGLMPGDASDDPMGALLDAADTLPETDDMSDAAP